MQDDSLYHEMSDQDLANLWILVAEGLTDAELDPILDSAMHAITGGKFFLDSREFSIFCLTSADNAELV